MHTYELRSQQEQSTCPEIGDFRFRSALDVAEWAEYNPYIGRSTHPDIWHLDAEGQFQCYTPSYTLNSLKRYAKDPHDLFISREHGLMLGNCPNRWLFIEPMLPWNDHPVPDEADASAFVVLRATLETIGVELVDAVMFDDAYHWWSMNELLTGSPFWSGTTASHLPTEHLSPGAPR